MRFSSGNLLFYHFWQEAKSSGLGKQQIVHVEARGQEYTGQVPPLSATTPTLAAWPRVIEHNPWQSRAVQMGTKS